VFNQKAVSGKCFVYMQRDAIERKILCHHIVLEMEQQLDFLFTIKKYSVIQIRREKVSVKQAFQQSKVNINISILTP
jgi:hypothetical protein